MSSCTKIIRLIPPSPILLLLLSAPGPGGNVTCGVLDGPIKCDMRCAAWDGCDARDLQYASCTATLTRCVLAYSEALMERWMVIRSEGRARRQFRKWAGQAGVTCRMSTMALYRRLLYTTGVFERV
ncbi:hypothetical protein EDB83DRAFT_2390781 [Lactarius deliciosus]|nr:hypothetical protein EDB83DRAFT_2390781 [Lactarius deliciosus]